MAVGDSRSIEAQQCLKYCTYINRTWRKTIGVPYIEVSRTMRFNALM